jgi:hypothetical protein
MGDTVLIKSNSDLYEKHRNVLFEVFDFTEYGTYIIKNANIEIEIEGKYIQKLTDREVEIMNSFDDEKAEKFTEIALEIGKFTDMKNKQYGSSVDATYKMMEVLMERYTYDKENYLMPKALLKHILLQVRMMDKQNRIFNNPSGKGDSESPYKDLTGYSLIGIDMVNKNI